MKTAKNPQNHKQLITDKTACSECLQFMKQESHAVAKKPHNVVCFAYILV